jgi:hypothetical protein
MPGQHRHGRRRVDPDELLVDERFVAVVLEE